MQAAIGRELYVTLVGAQLVADALNSVIRNWSMEGSFSPEGSQGEGNHLSSENTQHTPLHGPQSGMKSESRRLRTFRHWPAGVSVSPVDLAAAGFFFVGPNDTVKCFCCSGVLYSWLAGDNPMAEHQKFFPECRFIQDKVAGSCREMLWSREPQDCVDGQFLGMLQSLGVEETTADGQPEHLVMEAGLDRLRTFENWPCSALVSPILLARAGFFYTGQQDEAQCFSCGVLLSNWEQGEDPWIEHARWFPRCAYLLQSKGRDFIDSIQESIRMLSEGNVQRREDDLESSLVSETKTNPWRVRRETEMEHPYEPETVTSMEQKLHRLQEERRCKVCLDKDVSILLVPCGHLVVCAECAPNLSSCPICRGFIQDRMKAFLS